MKDGKLMLSMNDALPWRWKTPGHRIGATNLDIADTDILLRSRGPPRAALTPARENYARGEWVRSAPALPDPGAGGTSTAGRRRSGTSAS